MLHKRTALASPAIPTGGTFSPVLRCSISDVSRVAASVTSQASPYGIGENSDCEYQHLAVCGSYRDRRRGRPVAPCTRICARAGAVGVALIVYLSGHPDMNGGAIALQYMKTAAAKCELSFPSAFFKGVLCNFLVCIAVWMAMAGRTVADKILAIVFPISAFVAAGFEWRDAGCSMCLGMNPDILRPAERCASTSNRNFEGRQGPGGRTHLVSPVVAAATAIAGHFALPEDL